ncbi:MAG: WD40 repeat domain-containing protein [Flavobacteriales bacterium]|nr:WD40 repeat domain-containing protein [Flavobacteriales bacterium]
MKNTAFERRSIFVGHRGAVHAIAGTAHPNLFFSASGDGRVVRWDTRTPDAGELIADALKSIYTIHHDQERKLLFIGNSEGGLHVIDLVEREEVRLLQAHKRGIFRIIPFGNERIICSGGDGTISVWKVPSMELERQIPLSEEKIRGMSISPDGSMLAVASLDGSIRVLETTDMNEIHRLTGHKTGAASVCWHPKKPVLISGGRDGQLRFWRTSSNFKAIQAIPAHRANIYGIAFNPDGSLCATASRDKTVKIWDAKTFDQLDRIDLKNGGHTHSVNDVLWCADGCLLTASDDRSIRNWSFASGI